MGNKVAVLVLCYNNNSKDKTRELALAAGAIVKDEYAQGKGNVVRSMFRDIGGKKNKYFSLITKTTYYMNANIFGLLYKIGLMK